MGFNLKGKSVGQEQRGLMFPLHDYLGFSFLCVPHPGPHLGKIPQGYDNCCLLEPDNLFYITTIFASGFRVRNHHFYFL